MTIREWIRERKINGLPTFSFEELQGQFKNFSEQVVKNEIFRLSTQKTIVPVYKGFYVIIPPHTWQKE